MPRATKSDPASVPLYLAFPDGVFDYVCAECTAPCCKGFGFGGTLDDGSIRRVLDRYPALESTTIMRRGEAINFANLSGGCFFLDADNRCRIEKEFGKEHKPSVCNLFPFNNLTALGPIVAVTPHFMCPLRVRVPARPGEVQGTHATIEAEVRASPLLANGLASLTLRSVEMNAALDAKATVRREAEFCDACARSIGREPFSSTLRASSEDAAVLDAFLERAAALFGVPYATRAADRDEMDDLLLASAPALRLDSLRLSSEGIVRALAIFEVLARRIGSLAQRPLGVSEVVQMFANLRPALLLVAQGDEPLNLRRSLGKIPPYGDAALTFAAFAAQRGMSAGAGALPALERAIPPTLSTADRTALLISLGEIVTSAMSKKRTPAVEAR